MEKGILFSCINGYDMKRINIMRLAHKVVQKLLYFACELQHPFSRNFSTLFTFIFQNPKISCENYNYWIKYLFCNIKFYTKPFIENFYIYNKYNISSLFIFY